MPRKPSRPTFDQIVETLRSRGFEVLSSAEPQAGMLVSKYSAAAVLVPARDSEETAASLVEHPGILVHGRVARLLDRGYQKFIQTPEYELPASANQLHAIHRFSEEMMQLIGRTSLYNESLGTTSDLYQYDRLRGREHNPTPAGKRPWELADGH